MAQCAHCNTETHLYLGGVPICIKCSDLWETKRRPPAATQDIRTILFQNLLGATARNSEALREFDEVKDQFSSGVPHPDDAQLIKNASRKLSVARKEMGTAHNRLNNYLSRGIVPEDLKPKVQKASTA
jgi:hypothetical protein